MKALTWRKENSQNEGSLVYILQGIHPVGLMWWMLAREVLRLRGTISRETDWDVMPDLYFYRDPEEVTKIL